MAQFNGMELTTAGRNLIAKAIAGQPLKFTRAWAGDGTLTEDSDIDSMTGLINPVREMIIGKIEITEHTGISHVKVSMSNKELASGFFLREVGLFAQDPDSGEEVLYSYANAGNTADYIPAYGGVDSLDYYFNLSTFIDKAKVIQTVEVDNPMAVTPVELNEKADQIISRIKTLTDDLQRQINLLAQVSIRNSLEHMNKEGSE